MKKISLLVSLFISINAHAVSIKIYGPCSENPVFDENVKLNLNQSVGATSVAVFDSYGVPYIGSEMGFNSIVGTPTDHRTVEIVSDTELRAYGWCFSIDGKIPTEMPNEIYFESSKSELVWFYAYSTNKNNQWQDDYCTPAYKIKPKQICSKNYTSR